MSLSFVGSVRSCVKRAAAVAVMLGAVFASGGAWATDYTWCGGAIGDETNWYNPTNWGKTAVNDYPKTTSDKAIIPASLSATITLTNSVTIHTLTLNAGCSFALTGVATPSGIPQLKMNSGLTDNGVVKLKLDGVYFYRDTGWEPKAGSSIELTNGAKLYLSDFYLTKMDSVSLSGGSWMSVGSFYMNGAARTLTIDDSTFNVRSHGFFGTANPGGGKVVFKGSHPLLRVAGVFRSNNNSSGMTDKMHFDFEVPVGGFAEVPVQSYGEIMMNQGNPPAGYMQWTVLTTSPALSAETELDFCAYMNPRGMYRGRASNGDATTATMRFAADSPDVAATSDTAATLLYLTLGSGEPATEASHSGGILDYKTTSIARNVITAKGWITAVATDGNTSRLELWAGEANNTATMTLADSCEPDHVGTASLSFTAPEAIGEKTYYFQFRLYDVNGSVTNYTASTGTFSAATKDETVYTWKAKDGDWTGDWDDPDHWSTTVTTARGYPYTANSIAKFPRGHKIAVTINDNHTVGTVDCSDYNPDDKTDVIDLTLRGKEGEDYGTNKVLTVSTLSTGAYGGYFGLDRAAMKVSNNFSIGCERTLDIANGSWFYTAYITSNAGGKFLIRGDSYVSANGMLQENAASALTIEDAKFYLRYYLQHATANSTTSGGTVRFRGTHPVMRFAAGMCINHRANGAYTMTYTFEVPVGGYAAAPIQTDNGTCDFPQYYGANFLKFEIDPASPCYTQVATFDTPLVAWPGSAKVLTDGKNIFGTLADGGYFTYGTSGTPDYGWTDVASFSGTAKAIGAHVVSAAHDDKLTVATDCGVAITGIDPAVGATNQSDVASGAIIIFSAPASYEASGVRYTRTGYTLSEFTKTASGTTTNVTTGTDGSFNYTVANKEVALTWHYAIDYKVTTAVVNDADASVTVTSGSGYVKDDTPTTLTATTTSETMEFQYWYGDVPYANRYTNPLTLKGAKAMSVTAFFGKKRANAATIVASAGEVQPASPWFATSTWTGGVIPGTNDTAVVVWTKENGDARWRFKVEVPSFFAVGNLEISNACVRINNAAVPAWSSFYGALCSDYAYRTYSSVSDATDKQRYEAIGCDIFGSLTIDSIRPAWNNSRNGGYLMVGGTYQQCPSKVIVKGDLTLANGSILVAAGYRFDNLIIDAAKAIDGPSGFLPFTDYRAFFRGENVLRVGGKTTLKTPTIAAASHRNVIYTVNEFRTGVGVWLDLQDVEVQAKAGFTAYQGGYGKFDASGSVGRSYSMCPGGHCAGDNTSGGSYGGAGGSEESVYPAMKPTSHMATYGYANAPYYPGSHNGGDGGLSHPGAGSIRLDCGVLTLDGALMANGMEASGNKGGSSGGGIWVACSQFVPGADCAIEAKGGNASGNNSGGGGGRVSICEGLTAEQVESLFTNELHTATDATVSSLADKLGARFSAAGGTGTTSRSNGYDGTGVYIVNTAGKKTVTVVGDPSNLGAPEPAYGPHVVEQNAELSLAGPEDAYVSDDNRSRRSCAGYLITDTDGNVLVNSDSRTGSYTVTKDCTITWKLTTLVHKLAVEVTAGGSVTTNQIASADDPWQVDGSTISLTAVPQTGYAFAGWYGDLPTNLQANATLVFPSTKGRTVKALFVTTAAGAVAWTGAGDGTSWEDAANWDGVAIPGAASDVTIPNGANVTANFCVPVTVKSLTVDAGATLTFGPNSTYSTYSKPRVAENAVETDWQRIKLTVANDLTVNGTFTVGGKFSLSKFELDVGGALVFGEKAKGSFYAAYNASQAFLDSPTKRYDNTQADMELAAQYAESAWVTVGGTFSVATNAVVALWSDFYSGASVRFDVGSLLVANGGKIDADGKGWGYTVYSDLVYSLSPTLRDGSTYGYGGGTYGGLGGYSDTHSPSFKVYGWAYAPLLPGSPGFNTYGAPGGGVVRIHARESLRCYGTITAIGATHDQYFCNGYCGSGGGIFLTGARIRTGEKTVITADGQSVLQKNNCGAGAGGRLMIGLRLSDTDLAELCASGTCTRLGGKVTATDLMAGLPASWKGTITAKGGVNERTYYPDRRYSGEDGTAYLLQGPQPGFLLLVK